MNVDTAPESPAVPESAPAPADTAPESKPLARPLSNAEINGGYPTNNMGERAATTQPPAPDPVLPRLPRTPALLANEAHAQAVLEAAGPRGDMEGSIRGAINAQERMAKGLEALERARQSRNPSDTASRHLQRVEEAYGKLLTQAAREHDTAKDRIGERRRQLERQIDEQIGMAASPDAGEIRQALRNMTPEQRGKAIQAAIDNRDGAVLHAVLTGRELTTGVTAAQLRSFRRRAEERYAPDLAAVRAGLDKAEGLVASAFNDLESLADKVKGSRQVVSEFERRTAESDAAWLAFGKSLGGE